LDAVHVPHRPVVDEVLGEQRIGRVEVTTVDDVVEDAHDQLLGIHPAASLVGCRAGVRTPGRIGSPAGRIRLALRHLEVARRPLGDAAAAGLRGRTLSSSIAVAATHSICTKRTAVFWRSWMHVPAMLSHWLLGVARTSIAAQAARQATTTVAARRV